ncbi:MAG TPA: hypothetical protein VHF23_02380 [Gaiellaceae bacterium]|nr:hypothetical protein [Gaiellaceae bacterium]
MDLRRLFLRILVASLCVTAGLAIVTLLVAEFDETAGRILATTAFLAFFSLLAMPGGALLDRGRYTGLAGATLVLAGLAFLAAMVVVWSDWSEDLEDAWKALVVLGGFAGASSQTATLRARLRDGDRAGVLRLYLASLVLGFGLAFLIAVAALGEIEQAGFYRFLGAVAVANVLVALLQPVLRRLGGRPYEPGARLVVSLDRPPSPEAVDAALRALREYGPRIERS